MRPKGFLSLWYAWRKLCTYHAPTVTLSPNRPKRDSTWPRSPDIPQDTCHLRVPSGASKMISERMVRLAQTMHLSCTNTNTISKRTDRDFTRPTSPRSFPSGVSKMISESLVRSAQTTYQSCVKISTICKWTEMSFQLSFIT